MRKVSATRCLPRSTRGRHALVVDMTSTTFLDSAGVTALVRAARRAAATEATLRLAVTAPPVLRVLSLVGIDRLIEVYPGLPDAMASLPDQISRGLPACRAAASLACSPPRAGIHAHQPSSNGAVITGGSPLARVTIVAARSRSLTLVFWETLRSSANA